MYLDEIVAAIRSHIPEDRMPREDGRGLLRSYAVLLLAKGESVSLADIHNAWSAWMADKDASHESLVEFESLSDDTKHQDQIYASAVHRAARELSIGKEETRKPFGEVLFPSGPPSSSQIDLATVIDLYKVMVDSSESLVGRRQAVNTFFLTANGALVTAYGIILKNASDDELTPLGVLLLAGIGIILSFAWKSLITSFGQLNTGKFKVINYLEKYLPAAIYDAEWAALAEGKDPKIYKSFTAREKWVPNSLIVLHFLVALFSVLVVFELLDSPADVVKDIWCYFWDCSRAS